MIHVIKINDNCHPKKDGLKLILHLNNHEIMKNKKILFPTDFSKASQNAFDYCLNLLSDKEVNLEVIYIDPEPEVIVDGRTEVTEATINNNTKNRNRLKSFVDQSGQNNQQQSNISINIESGNPVNEIVSVSKRDVVDLIFMGSRGRSSEDKIWGSVTSEVVRNSQKPVFVIPKDCGFKKINKVVYATDLHSADPFMMWLAIDLLLPFLGKTPEIHFIHFNYKKEGDYASTQKMEQMEAFFKQHELGKHIYFDGFLGKKLEDDFNAYTKSKEIDLLIMYQDLNNFHWAEESSTMKMALHTSIPLLVWK